MLVQSLQKRWIQLSRPRESKHDSEKNMNTHSGLAAGRSRSPRSFSARKVMSIRQGEIMWGDILIAPTVIGLGVFYLWPVLETLYISMTKQGPVGGSSWVGISNFERLGTPEFGQWLLNTLGYTAIVVFLGVPVATVLAAMFSTTKLRFPLFYHSSFFT